VDYTNPNVKDILKKYEPMGSKAIRREILKQRCLHWGFLPSDLRRKLIRRKYRSW
jgi:hypothetical protein